MNYSAAFMAETPLSLPKAVIFDAYGTLFDVHSVLAAAEQLFAGRGHELSLLWRQKQIEYTQLRTLAGLQGEHYRNFWDITIDALRHTAAKLGLDLTAGIEKRLMDEYACLSVFPDTVPVLRQLREAGIGLAILSNGNPQMLEVAVKSSGMAGLFDHVLSVDSVRLFKPAAAAYSLGTTAFGAAPREIAFVSSNSWDICGATWFGYTTFWLNRTHAPLDELGVSPHGTGSGMAELPPFLQRAPRGLERATDKPRAAAKAGARGHPR